MKKIYEEFLKIPKNEKIREKVLMTRISLSIVIMVLCLGAMGITAYAYFSCNITSAVTTIQSARYELNVTVTETAQLGDENAGVAAATEDAVSEGVTEGNVSDNVQPVEIVPNEEGYYIFENVATEEKPEVKDRFYDFVLTKPETSTATVGFGKFEVLTDVNEADGSRQIYYTTPIGTYVKDGNIIESNKYKLQLRVPANKTVKVKVLAEWGTCARGPAMPTETALDPDFVDSKYMHIAIDDVSNCLLRLKNTEYTSLYDEPFFAWLKKLHNSYGAKFSLYTYVNVLEHVPDTYKEEFAEAKDWLKISLHAEDAASSYADVNLTHDYGRTIWKQFAENVFRITGTYQSIDRMPKLEGSAGSKEVLLGMKDAVSDSGYKYGAIGCLADKIQANGQTLFTDDFYIDDGFVFVSTDIVFGGLDADPVKRQEQYGAAASMHSCIALLHEGQVYDENGFIADANGNMEFLKSQVEELCKFANEKGIKFNYPQTRNFDAIQEMKDVEKAAKEAAEKAAQEAAEKETKEAAQETAEKVFEGATTDTFQESVDDTAQEEDNKVSRKSTKQGQKEETEATDIPSQTQSSE